MDRGNKHGARMDEDLKRDTRAGEEARVPDADDDGEAPRAGRDVPPPVEGHVYEPDVDERSDLARFIDPSVFPARRPDLLASAEGNFAPERVLALIRRLPEGEEFGNTQAVWRALGGPTEQRA